LLPRKAPLTPLSIPSGGIGTFGPLIVQSFGFNKFKTILFNIPFGLVNIIAILSGGWLATHIKSKGIVIAILALPCIVGASILLALPRGPHSKGPLLFAYYCTSFLAGITPLIYSWHIQNTAGDTKRKITTALVFIGMCAGNIIGPLLYSTEEKPYYRTGLISNLVMFCFVEVLVGYVSPPFKKNITDILALSFSISNFSMFATAECVLLLANPLKFKTNP
jgi:predicted MFS family arabinose efflux permease